jgi:hypothetical protein
MDEENATQPIYSLLNFPRPKSVKKAYPEQPRFCQVFVGFVACKISSDGLHVRRSRYSVLGRTDLLYLPKYVPRLLQEVPNTPLVPDRNTVFMAIINNHIQKGVNYIR